MAVRTNSPCVSPHSGEQTCTVCEALYPGGRKEQTHKGVRPTGATAREQICAQGLAHMSHKRLLASGFDTTETSGGIAHSIPSRRPRATDMHGTWSWRRTLHGFFSTRLTRTESIPYLARWSTALVAIIRLNSSRCTCLSEPTGGAGS